MKNLRRLARKLLKALPALTLTSLLLVCALSLPSYATNEEIWATPDGNVAMSPGAAAEILQELKTLRAERNILIQALQDERDATSRLIQTVDEYRQQVQAEREASQTLIADLQKQIKEERRRAKQYAILGSVGIILAIIF